MVVDIRKQPSKKRRSLKRRLIAALCLLCSLALLCTVYIDQRLKPIMKSVAVANAKSIATRAVNEAVNEKMKTLNVLYDELVTFEKDADGRITALKTNSFKINDIKSSISVAVLDKVLAVKNTSVYIPMGNIVNGELFLGRGPKIEIKMSTVGSVQADVDNVFISAGINQTRHQIVLKLTAIVGIILPGSTEYAEVTTKIVIAETVLVGTVPDSYTRVDGDDQGIVGKINDYAGK